MGLKVLYMCLRLCVYTCVCLHVCICMCIQRTSVVGNTAITTLPRHQLSRRTDSQIQRGCLKSRIIIWCFGKEK